MIRLPHILLALLLMPLTASGEAFETYSKERFQALSESDTPVLVEVFADWCGTCRRQAPILAELLGQPEFADFKALRVDWDRERDAARELGAPRQSTLFVYRGGEQLAISVADTDPDRLRAFLRSGLN